MSLGYSSSLDVGMEKDVIEGEGECEGHGREAGRNG